MNYYKDASFKYLIYLNIILVLLISAFDGVQAESSLILDRHTHANNGFAYSFRKLDKDYSGPALKIRRDCDSSLLDIGFDSNNSLDITAIENFVNTCPDSDNTLPLDIVGAPSAAAAYSLRKIRSAYSGFALQVRRISDDVTLDIGFTPDGLLDTTAIETFCGASDCLVRIWYDQSGNSNNADQIASPSSQAKIYDATDGIVTNQAGQVAIGTDGTNDIYTTNVSIGTAHSLIAVATRNVQPIDTGSQYRPLVGNDSIPHDNLISYGVSIGGTGHIIVAQHDGDTKIDSESWVIGEKALFTVISKGQGNNNIEVYKNQTLVDISDISSDADYGDLRLFGQPGSVQRHFAGFINEIIFYNQDISSHRQEIQRQVGDYYGTLDLAYLHTWFDQSGNNNHAIQADFNKQARIYDDGMILDPNGNNSLLSDGVFDIYPTQFNIDETHSVFSSVTKLKQTSQGSFFRPFLANGLSDYNEYLGYGTANDGQDDLVSVSQKGAFRSSNSAGGSWLADEQIIFSVLSDQNNVTSYKNSSNLTSRTENLNFNFNEAFLLGTEADTGRYFRGHMNEIILYDTRRDADNLDIEYDLAHANNFTYQSFIDTFTLSNNQIKTKMPAYTLIGTLNTTANNGSGNYTYKIINDPDNSFVITNANELRTARVLDHSAASTLPVTIRVTDNDDDKFIESIFNIQISSIFDGETIIGFNSVYAGSPINTVVGEFTTLNKGYTGASHTYTLLDDAGGSFKLDGDTLKIAKVLNFQDTDPKLSITLRATVTGETAYHDQKFKIRILKPLDLIDITQDNDNDEDMDNDETDDDLTNLIPDFIDKDSNQEISDHELLDTLLISNKYIYLRRFKRNFNFNQNYDVNNDNVYDFQDFNLIEQYLKSNKNYDYMKNLLNEIGTNRKGNITFKKARKIRRKFLKINNDLNNNSIRDKDQGLVEVFDVNNDQILDDTDFNKLIFVLEKALKKKDTNSQVKRIKKFVQRSNKKNNSLN